MRLPILYTQKQAILQMHRSCLGPLVVRAPTNSNNMLNNSFRGKLKLGTINPDTEAAPTSKGIKIRRHFNSVQMATTAADEPPRATPTKHAQWEMLHGVHAHGGDIKRRSKRKRRTLCFSCTKVCFHLN